MATSDLKVDGVPLATALHDPRRGTPTDVCDDDPSIIWSKLGFEFRRTKHMYLAHTTQEGVGADASAVWQDKGGVVRFRDMQLSPAAAVLNYAQAVFEGLKAMRTPQGKIVLFRPEDNACRFRRSAAKLGMPPLPVDWFTQAVIALIRQEAGYVPPYFVQGWPAECPAGSRSLYIRPVMIASGAVLGVKPAHEYTFYIFVSPVGIYRTTGALLVLDSTHRAPSFGIGDVKAAANYPATLRPLGAVAEMNRAQLERDEAERIAYADVLYLDARHDTYIEEVGSSNFFAILKDGTLVTPRQGSILPGITRDSIMVIARELLGWRVVERDVALQEVLADADEVFFTGTAAVVVPVTHIRYKGVDHAFRAAHTPDTRAQLLKSRLLAIQTQQEDDPFGWVREVEIAPRHRGNHHSPTMSAHTMDG